MKNRFIGALQTTISKEFVLTGTGVHSGKPASIILHPAAADTGVRFIITDGEAITAEIAATYEAVSNVTLCTVLADGNGAQVATVEHLLSAVRGIGIDNLLIEIDSNEVPIMDGSAEPFINALDDAGIRVLGSPRRFLKILKRLRVADGESSAELKPHNGFHLDVEINFDSKLIGKQRYQIELNPGNFRKELGRARTFGFMKDAQRLWASGLALGVSLENTVAIDENRILNPEGLRYKDEFVRHKAMDAVGDLALAGAPILGAFKSIRGGHRLNYMVLQALFADSDAWTMAEAPMVHRTGHVELPQGAAVANFAANRT